MSFLRQRSVIIVCAVTLTLAVMIFCTVQNTPTHKANGPGVGVRLNTHWHIGRGINQLPVPDRESSKQDKFKCLFEAPALDLGLFHIFLSLNPLSVGIDFGRQEFDVYRRHNLTSEVDHHTERVKYL